MPLKPDTSKIGLVIGGSIVCLSIVVLAILSVRAFADRTTDLPFPKAEASTDMVALRKSANDGNAESQLALAGLFFVGKNEVPKDAATSVQWLSRSAEQGNVTAQLILGLLYYRGEAVAQDFPTAKEWFAKAGHQGNAEAQYYLGIVFESGKGAPESRSKAYVWWSLAKAQGHEKADIALEELKKSMTDSELAEAQKFTLEKQEEIKVSIATPENSVSQLLREAQQVQDELRGKTDEAEAELERIRRQDGDASKVLTKALPSVVTVIVPGGDDTVSQGTAFFIDDYTLITNFHVVEPVAYEDRTYALGSGPPVIIVDDQKRARIAQVIATGGGTNDLAALAVTNLVLQNGDFVVDYPSPFPSLSLQSTARQGQTVFAVGSPQSFTESITKGIISAVRTSNSGMEFIQTDAEITHGNSGGPLLNTASEVVGVNTLSIDGVKFAIGASSVETFLGNIPESHRGVAYLDPSDFNSGTSGTPQQQPTYRETTPPTPTISTPPPAPTPTHDCSEFGSNAFYSYAEASCVCNTGYYANNNTCVKVPNCVSNSTFNYTAKQCECDYGYYVKDGKCYEEVDCPYNSSFDEDAGKCYCNTGYVSQGGTCISEYLACGYSGTYNRQTGACDCDEGYYKQNGSCVREPSCYGGTFNQQTGGCICDSDYYPKDGSCVRKSYCGTGGYFSVEDERCLCNAGYSLNGSYCMKDYNY